MNGKQAKRLRKYCKKYDEPYDLLKRQYKAVDWTGKTKLSIHLKRYNHEK